MTNDSLAAALESGAVIPATDHVHCDSDPIECNFEALEGQYNEVVGQTVAQLAALVRLASRVELLEQALRDIAERHSPTDEEVEYYHGDGDDDRQGPCPSPDRYGCAGHSETIRVCSDCGYGHDGEQPTYYGWPCPTVKLAAAALDADGAVLRSLLAGEPT